MSPFYFPIYNSLHCSLEEEEKISYRQEGSTLYITRIHHVEARLDGAPEPRW